MTRNLIRRIASNRALSSQRGFTLVELIVVLVIISLLMGFLLSGIWNSSQGAKAKLTEMKLQKLKSAINQYQLMHNRLPQSLQALTTCGDGGGACVKVAEEDDLKDAWGGNIALVADGGGRAYRIKSAGADGKDGGTDANSDIYLDGP